MAKITLNNVTSGYNLSLINENFQKVASELNSKVLYRTNVVGESNSMSTTLDMNGFRIINLPVAVEDSDPVTYGAFKVIVDQVTVNKDLSNLYAQQALGYSESAAASASSAAGSAATVAGQSEALAALLNIGIAQATVVDGELIMTYVDAQVSTLAVVDGELQVSYT